MYFLKSFQGLVTMHGDGRRQLVSKTQDGKRKYRKQLEKSLGAATSHIE
jgi:hypothetical protein